MELTQKEIQALKRDIKALTGEKLADLWKWYTIERLTPDKAKFLTDILLEALDRYQ